MEFIHSDISYVRILYISKMAILFLKIVTVHLSVFLYFLVFDLFPSSQENSLVTIINSIYTIWILEQ